MQEIVKFNKIKKKNRYVLNVNDLIYDLFLKSDKSYSNISSSENIKGMPTSFSRLAAVVL